jgi:hypothetical protein
MVLTSSRERDGEGRKRGRDRERENGKGRWEEGSGEEKRGQSKERREGENETTCTSGLPFLPLLFCLGPAYRIVLPTFRAGLPPLVNLSRTLLQTHPEVCFPNLLGISQSNQVNSED